MKSLIWGVVVGAIVAGAYWYVDSKRTYIEKTAAGHRVSVPPRVREEVPEAFLEALLDVESMELISLHPFPESLDSEVWKRDGLGSAPRLGEYAVLGTVLLDGPDLAAAVNQLYRGIGAGKGKFSGSAFRPRHALRVRVHRSKDILEVLMDYELGTLRWRRNKVVYERSTTSTTPREYFDARLTEAGVPLPTR